jgi:hypothetical protein
MRRFAPNKIIAANAGYVLQSYQAKVDLNAFVRLLIAFGAKKTADAVVSALRIIRDTGAATKMIAYAATTEPSFEKKFGSGYVTTSVAPTFRRYAERSQSIIDHGGSVLNPKEWPRDWKNV